MSRGGRSLVALAVLLTAGCFAQRKDVVLLHNEVRAMRAESQGRMEELFARLVRSDSVNRTQVSIVLAQLARLSDTVRALNGNVLQFRTNLAQQVLDLQESVYSLAQSQRVSDDVLRSIREELEAAKRTIAASQGVAGTGAPVQRTASTLLAEANALYERGSFGTAREAYEEILKDFPGSPQEPVALYYVGLTHDKDNNQVAADSVFQVVVSKYPETDQAPQALFKLGMRQLDLGNREAARRYFDKIVSSYANSPVASLAKERLNSIPPQ